MLKLLSTQGWNLQVSTKPLQTCCCSMRINVVSGGTPVCPGIWGHMQKERTALPPSTMKIKVIFNDFTAASSILRDRKGRWGHPGSLPSHCWLRHVAGCSEWQGKAFDFSVNLQPETLGRGAEPCLECDSVAESPSH